ncbi:hypothetical protein LZ654_13830 [Lelliottia amnigena]|jgi:hypothetical protein|nr:hypothetical protein [Lelliottia amnigena]MCE9965898.1 hypothetical protein [Lelliottia amnigena]
MMTTAENISESDFKVPADLVEGHLESSKKSFSGIQKMKVTTEAQQLVEHLKEQLSSSEIMNKKISAVSWGLRTLLTDLESAHLNITHILNTDHLNLSASLSSSLGQFLKDADSLKSLLNNSAMYHSVCQEPDHREEPTTGHGIPFFESSRGSSSFSDTQDDVEQQFHQDAARNP